MHKVDRSHIFCLCSTPESLSITIKEYKIDSLEPLCKTREQEKDDSRPDCQQNFEGWKIDES